jgi:hypothetical protein
MFPSMENLEMPGHVVFFLHIFFFTDSGYSNIHNSLFEASLAVVTTEIQVECCEFCKMFFFMDLVCDQLAWCKRIHNVIIEQKEKKLLTILDVDVKFIWRYPYKYIC